MNDKILTENLLLLLKSNTEMYLHGTLESSNNLLFNTFKNCLNDTLKMQNDLYNKMTEYGWYSIENVSNKTLNQTLKKLQNKN